MWFVCAYPSIVDYNDSGSSARFSDDLSSWVFYDECSLHNSDCDGTSDMLLQDMHSKICRFRNL